MAVLFKYNHWMNVCTTFLEKNIKRMLLCQSNNRVFQNCFILKPIEHAIKVIKNMLLLCNKIN